MVKWATNRNNPYHYGGVIYPAFSTHNVWFVFCDSYEEYVICTQTSMIHSEGYVHSLEKSVKTHKENKYAIALVVDQQMLPHTKHIAIKYHHL